MKTFFLRTGLVIILALAPWIALDAQAITYDFAQITHNGSTNVSSQLRVEVTDAGSDGVRFHFSNSGPTASSITVIYFDDGALLSIAAIVNGPRVSFSPGASPPNLPGGKRIFPAFETTASFSADRPPPKKGVNPGEYVDIMFDLNTNKTFADVITALNLGIDDPAAEGSLRIGLHIQAIGNASRGEGFIHIYTPIPGGVLLLGTGLLGLGLLSWRRQRS